MPFALGTYTKNATCDACGRMFHPDDEVVVHIGGKVRLAPGYDNQLEMIEQEQRTVVHADCPKE